MPVITITFDIDLTDSEIEQLAGTIDVSENELDASLAPYCKAASLEAIRMYLGQRVFTRGSDIREYRLLLLIQKAFGNRLPSAELVCGLFQTSLSEARSLLRSVISKYQYDLFDAISTSSKETLEHAKKVDGRDEWVVVVDNDNIVEALNRKLGNIDGSLTTIKKKPNSLRTYIIKPASYEALLEDLGLETDE